MSRGRAGPPAAGRRSTSPVTNRVGRVAVAAKNVVSSTPSAATSARRVGASTSGVPWATTTRITGAQPTPRSRRTCCTESASRPTRRVASAFTRSVSTARGRTAPCRSVQILGAHRDPSSARASQRHPRFSQHRRTGRPRPADPAPTRPPVVQPRQPAAGPAERLHHIALHDDLQLVAEVNRGAHHETRQPEHGHRVVARLDARLTGNLGCHLGPSPVVISTTDLESPARSHPLITGPAVSPLPRLLEKSRPSRLP